MQFSDLQEKLRSIISILMSHIDCVVAGYNKKHPIFILNIKWLNQVLVIVAIALLLDNMLLTCVGNSHPP